MDVNTLINFKDSNGTNNVIYPVTKKSNVIDLEQDLSNMASSINSVSSTVTSLETAVDGKVDKVSGKDLSTNDFTDALKNKLDGIESGANAYTHPTTSGNKHIPAGGSSGKILGWSADGTAVWVDNSGGESYSDATTTTHGLMSAADKSKLDGIDTNANNYVHPTNSGNKHIPSGGTSGQILGWSSDGTAQWVDDHNTEYSDATTTVHGLMSTSDKAKLDGIAANANNYTLPNATSSTLGGIKAGSNLSINNGVLSLTQANVISALGYKPPDVTGYTYVLSDFASFNVNNIAPAFAELMNVIQEGDSAILPSGDYIATQTIDLRNLPKHCRLDLYGTITAGTNNMTLIKLSNPENEAFCNIFIEHLKGASGQEIAIDICDMFSYNNVQVMDIDNFKYGLYFKMRSTRNFVQYSRFIWQYIRNCDKCIYLDGEDRIGWVNENTFVGGHLRGNYGVYIKGGTSETNIGFDGNKFYNVGFEQIFIDGIYIDGEAYSNAWMHCRAIENIDGYLINEVSSGLGHNQFWFDHVIRAEKIHLTNASSEVHATISNSYDEWAGGSYKKNLIAPRNVTDVMKFQDKTITQELAASSNTVYTYGIPALNRYKVFDATIIKETSEGDEHRKVDVFITDIDFDQSTITIRFENKWDFATTINVTFRALYWWRGVI